MAKKRLNKNVVVGLTLAGFVGMILVAVVLLRLQQSRGPKFFVATAEQAVANEDWGKAALFYRKAFQQSKEDGGGAGYLVEGGKAKLAMGEVREALGFWQEALRNQPDLVEAHRMQLDLMLNFAKLQNRIQDWQTIRQLAESMIESLKDPAQEDVAFAQYTKGLALVSLRRMDESLTAPGIAALEKACTLAPDNVDYAIDLAIQLVGLDRRDEAEAKFDELINTHTKPGAAAAKVRCAKADLLVAERKDLDKAEALYTEATELAKDDPKALLDAKLGYASLLSQRWAITRVLKDDEETAKRYLTEAEGVLRACIEMAPEGYDAYVQAALLFQASGQHAEAVKTCRTRLAKGLVRTGVDATRNRVSTFRLNLLAARAELSQAADEKDLAARESHFAAAQQFIDDAAGEFADHPLMLTQRGRLKLARGEDRAALEDFREAHETFRESSSLDWETIRLLTQLHMQLNEPGAAKVVMEQVVEQARASRATDLGYWILYAQVLLENEEYDRTIGVCNDILRTAPQNNSALTLKAAAQERSGRLGDAKNTIENASSGAARHKPFLAYKDLKNGGDIDGAINVLLGALSAEPANERLVATVVTELHAQGRLDEARDVVARAREAAPNNSRLEILEATLAPDLTEEERAARVFDVIQTEPDAYKRGWDMIEFYQRQGDHASVLKAIDETLAHLVAKDTDLAKQTTVKDHRVLLKMKLRAAGLAEDDAAQAAARDDAATYNVDGTGGKSILGLYHLQRQEIDLAISALTAMIEQQQTDAESLAALGLCMQYKDRTDDARNYYERALSSNPKEALAHRGLALIADQAGDREAFEKHLEVCKRLIPHDPWVVEVEARERDRAEPLKAIEQRERRLAEDPDDTMNLLQLAALCWMVEDTAKADTYYDRLIELDSDNKNFAVAAAKYYRATDRPDRALAIVTNYAAGRTVPEEQAEAQILVAAHYLSLEDMDKVETTLLEAAKTAQTLEVTAALAEFYTHGFVAPAKARAWLDKAIDLAAAKKSAKLPKLLAARVHCVLDPAINDLAAARVDVNRLLRDYPDNQTGILLQSEIRARDGDIEGAVASLSHYLQLWPDQPTALYPRARHYIALGRLAQAAADLETIKRTAPPALQVEARVLLARMHQRDGRISDAVRELETLVQLAPASDVAHEELVRTYLAEKRYREADRVVTSRINRYKDAPVSRWFYMRGQVSLELGDTEKAIEDYMRGAEIDGFSTDAVNVVADVYLTAHRCRDGVAFVKAHPEAEAASTLARYARLLACAGDTQASVATFRDAMLAAGPLGTAGAGLVLGQLRATFPVDQALTLFGEAPADPATKRANDRLLADIYRRGGRIDDALATLAGLLDTAGIGAERAGIHHDRGALLHMVGRHEEARAAYEKALQEEPDNWATLNNLAYLLSDALGKHDLALPYAQRAVQIADQPALRSQLPDLLDTLGWIFVGVGDYPQAIAELSRAVRLEPDLALAYYHLSEAYRRNGQFGEAASVGKTAKTLTESNGNAELLEQVRESLQRVGRRDNGA